MMTPQKMYLLGFFDLEMVDLKMITTHFDSSFRRLLASTTETEGEGRVWDSQENMKRKGLVNQAHVTMN